MNLVKMETITNTLLWCKILLLNGFNLIGAKQKKDMRLRKVYQNSWSRRTDRKLYTQTTRCNLGKRVKVYHGITALIHLIDPRQIASLKEPFEKKRYFQQYCSSQDWMKRWWSDSMECFCCLRNVQDLLESGKTPYERRFGESFKGPLYRLEQWLNTTRFLQKTNQEFINLARKY